MPNMAPTRTRKQRSTESTTSLDVASFPAPPTMLPTKMSSPARTPSNRSPVKKAKRGLTIAQKQALIDNLQLEITERARKLRAQYNLQAQGMRTRIEIRVNRIPMALRKANMGDLFAKHSGGAPKIAAMQSTQVKQSSPARAIAQKPQARASPSQQRPRKRPSDEVSLEDKENENVENPKKRAKNEAILPPARTASRRIPPSQVLSPRSANSRTIPRSPIRPPTAMSGATKSFLARPVSPMKLTGPIPAGGAAGILTSMVEKAKTRGVAASKKATEASSAVGRGRRPAVPTTASAPKVGRVQTSMISESSESSTSTVVRKPILPTKKEPVKKTMMGAIRGIGARKPPVVPPKSTAPAGRVLRKRN